MLSLVEQKKVRNIVLTEGDTKISVAQMVQFSMYIKALMIQGSLIAKEVIGEEDTEEVKTEKTLINGYITKMKALATDVLMNENKHTQMALNVFVSYCASSNNQKYHFTNINSLDSGGWNTLINYLLPGEKTGGETMIDYIFSVVANITIEERQAYKGR